MTGDDQPFAPPPVPGGHFEAFFATRRRSDACISDWALDQVATGEATTAQAHAIRAHLAGCAACAQAARAHAEAAEAFVAGLDKRVEAALTAVPPVPVRRRAAMAAGAFAAALGAWALLARPVPPVTRSKGGFSLVTYVQAGGAPARLYFGEPLGPGDRVQFRYHGDRAGFLAAVSRASDGTVSVFYPLGEHAAVVSAGRDVQLASAVELDASTGREVVVAVRCERAFPVAALAEMVRREPGDARSSAPVLPLDSLNAGACAEFRTAIAKASTP